MRQLLVSIHDVTPAHEARIRTILDLFGALGVRRYALLVVPNYHGAFPLADHPGFVDSLRQQQRDGAEIFLHGLRHDEVGLRRTWSQRVIAAGRTDGEGEFLSLDPAETAARVDEGIRVLRDCRLKPVGFIPPAWLFGSDTIEVIRERNLRITEGIVAISDIVSHRRLVAPPLAWDTRARWLAAGCALLVALRRRLEAPRRVVRLAIHPPDVDDPIVAPSLGYTIRRLLVARNPVSYHAALGIE
ncbi:MAG TPA: polysaccharide deacetylase family protein [Gemmatimonadales bacterium]